MDHEHMHHDSGLGMDYNYAFAQDYWYILASIVGVLAAVRIVHLYAGKQRLKACQEAPIEHATRPNGRISQAWATATAAIREISHPQFHVSRFGLRWATPPPMGRIIVLLCYWAMMTYLMVWNAVHDDAYYWERIGYRGAWVSIMQLPFIYLLSMKFSIVGFLIGSSHERLNWLHRWVARTMFVTATVHGWHFWTEWARADFVEYELQIMPSVRYGLGAWGVLLLNVVVGFLPIRRIVYEMWLVQHVLSSVAMLVLLSYHIPASATYLLWMSVSFLACDRAARWAMTGWQNTRWKVGKSACRCRGGMKRLGHNVHARAVGDSVTVLTIEDAHFKWHPGQHIYLWIPRLGLLESHPYTIACAHRPTETSCCHSVQLVVRAHEGFSKRLHRHAVKHPDKGLTGFVLGPLGATTNWNAYETVILIGASTGASFTVPILEHVAGTSTSTCVRRIEVALMARRAEEMEYYAERAKEAAMTAREKGIEVTLHIAITGTSADGASDSDSTFADSKDSKDSRNSTATMPPVRQYTSRPDIETLIRRPVEQAWGESAVVVCGGREIVARTRNCLDLTRRSSTQPPHDRPTERHDGGTSDEPRLVLLRRDTHINQHTVDGGGMAGWRFPGWLMLARALARGLAWATDIVAIVVLCFIAQRWTATCGAVAPGIVGTVIALFVDSWQMVASAGRCFGFEPVKPRRTLVYDTFSFAVTLGGLVSMLVSNATAQHGDEQVDYFGQDAGRIHFRKSSMTLVAIWLLGVVVAWRIGFAIWACVDCYTNHQRAARRHERSTEDRRTLY